MINQEFAKQVLRENAAQCEMSVKEHTEYSLEEDPTFAAWLLGADNVGDYGVGATPEQQAEIAEFIKSL